MRPGWVLFDWGDTLMVDFSESSGPMATWSRVEAVAGAAEMLAVLRASGWRTALATNAADSDEAEIRAALARVGLDSLIDNVYCSRRVGHAKPSQEFFDHIIADLGRSSDELVMVGDSLRTDIQGARRAGIRGVLFRSGSVSGWLDDSSMVVGDLLELPAVLAMWNGTDLTSASSRAPGAVL